MRGNRIYEEKAINEKVRQVIHFVYNKAGRLTERREELESGLEPAAGEYRTAVTTYGYDENGNRILTQTPEGYRITREYDTLDRLTSERVEDHLNGIDRTVRVNYDKAGNITKLVRQGKDGMPWEISYSYDLKDRITHANDYFGPVFQYEYDKNDRLLKEALAGAELDWSYAYAYDYRGNLVTETDSEGTLQEKHLYRTDGKLMHSQFADGNELEYSYGINGMQQEIRTARSQQADRAAQVYTYDARGRITGIQDGNQNQTGYHMDPWGRVHQIETAEGGKENFTYDYAGHVTSTTDANGGVITYRYNSQGKVCEIIDQEGNSETFRYDREGRRIFHEDRIGNQVRTTYNVDGRPVLERACDHMGENEVSRSWEYDGIGNVKKAVAGGFCYTYEYRPDGKLIKKSSSGRTLISCTYHADKSLKSLTDVSGKTVHYGYDSLGRLKRICDDNGEEIVRYGHTAGGKLKEIRHGNGMHTAYEYDTDDNIIRLTLKNEKGIVFSDFRYEYDLNGNRILKSGSCLLPVEDKIKEQVVRYRYDCMDRLMEEQYDGKPVEYIYDRCGNRLVRVDSDGKEEYHYNRKNQLISRKKGTESVEYRYDLQGNILEEASNRGRTEYGYNAFNQQTTTFMHNGQIQENWYDAEFLRAEVSENGCSSRFLYYNGELLAESELNDTVRNRYILGYGVAASWQKEGYHSYHLDEQNSTAYITDSDQRVEDSYQYDAFGVIREKKENVYNRILYTGQQYDQVTGQHYLRARCYNPLLGRFLQEDVYRGDGLNLYVYCENNPVRYHDPSGYYKAGESLFIDSVISRRGSSSDLKVGILSQLTGTNVLGSVRVGSHQAQHIIPNSLSDHPIISISGYQVDHYENGILDINRNSKTPGALEDFLSDYNVSKENMNKFVSNNTHHGVADGSSYNHEAYNTYVKSQLDIIDEKYGLSESLKTRGADDIRAEFANTGKMSNLREDITKLNERLRTANQDGIDLYLKNDYNTGVTDYYEGGLTKAQAQEKYEKENFKKSSGEENTGDKCN